MQRGNVRLSNLQVMNAVLYVAEQGCKWRGLPKRFGRWHTIYTRLNRCSRNVVLDRVFEKLRMEQIVRIKIETFALDSTSIKVHPDGTGALKNGPQAIGKSRGGWNTKVHLVAAKCSNGHYLRAVPWQRPRRTRRTRSAEPTWSYGGGPADVDGSRLRGRRNQTVGAQPRHDPGGSSQVQPHRAVGSMIARSTRNVTRSRDYSAASRASVESSIASRNSTFCSSDSSTSHSSSKRSASVDTPR